MAPESAEESLMRCTVRGEADPEARLPDTDRVCLSLGCKGDKKDSIAPDRGSEALACGRIVHPGNQA